MEMQIEVVRFKIVGTKPLLQSSAALREEASTGLNVRKAKQNTGAFVMAENGLYMTAEGLFYHPAQAFWTAMMLACPNIKIGKQAASTFIPRAIEPAGEEFILYDPETLERKKPRALTAKDWVVDSRAVPIRSASGQQKGSTIVHRAKWKVWGGLLLLNVNRAFIPQELDDIVLEILNIAGEMGIGCGRLIRNGSTWSGIRMGKFHAEKLK